MIVLAPFLLGSTAPPLAGRPIPMFHGILTGWPWAGVWICLTLLSSVSYAAHLVVARELGTGEEMPGPGPWLWPIAGALAMALNAAVVWRQATLRAGIPDYIVWWWIVSFSVCLASAIVGVTPAKSGDAASTEQILAVTRAALFGPLALVAGINVLSRCRLSDTVDCFGLLIGMQPRTRKAPPALATTGAAVVSGSGSASTPLRAGAAAHPSAASPKSRAVLANGGYGTLAADDHDTSASTPAALLGHEDAPLGKLSSEYSTDYRPDDPRSEIFGPAALSGKHAIGGKPAAPAADAAADTAAPALSDEELEAAAAERAAEAAAAWRGLSPEESAGLCSRLVFFWMQPVLVRGWAQPLDGADVPPLARADRARFVGGSFAQEWDRQVETARKARAEAKLSPQAAKADPAWDAEAAERSAAPKAASAADAAMAPATCGWRWWGSILWKAVSCVTATGGCLSGGARCCRFLICGRIRGAPYRPSLPVALARAYGPMLYQALAFKLVYDLLQFAGPALLNSVVVYLTDVAKGAEGASAGVGFGYVGLMAASAVTQTIVLHQYFIRVFRVGLRLRTAVTGAVFRKALRLSVSARQRRTVGQIVNIMSTDANRMRDLTTYLVMLESGPLQIALSVAFLWQQIGAAVLVGVAVMVLFIPLNLAIARLQKRLQKELMVVKDKRVNSTSEAIGAAKLIKLNAWEERIVGRIEETRSKEVGKLWTYMLVRNISSMLWVGLPLIVSLVSFATFVWTGGQLTAAKAFTSLSLFGILRFPLAMFPSVINNCIEALVSVERIESFLGAGEVEEGCCARVDTLGLGTGSGDVDPRAAEHRATSALPAVELRDASFSWSLAEVPDAPAAAAGKGSASAQAAATGAYQAVPDGPGVDGTALRTSPDQAGGAAPGRAVLAGVSLEVKRGELLTVVGRVGSGKTSLLHGMLGELHRISGSATIRGSVAFVSQSPFILNDTLQNNILFGRPMNRARYSLCLRVCQLEQDLKELPGGDQCEIGERGINLSGGTRARVSLARGVYADCDTYLLDDPLSAVDAHVGNRIFTDCICGTLSGRTRVLVTHGVPYMRRSDRVAVISAGRLVQLDTYRALAHGESAGGEGLAAILASYADEEARMAAATADDGGATAAGAGSASGSEAGSSDSGAAAAAGGATAGDDDDLVDILDEDEGDEEEAELARLASPGAVAPDASATGAAGASAAAAGTAPSQADALLGPRGTAPAPAEGKGGKGGVATEAARKVEGKLIGREKIGRGTVRLSVLGSYIKAMGGWGYAILLVSLFALSQGSQVLVNWWLSHWSSSVQGMPAEQAKAANQDYLAGYAGLSALSFLIVLVLRVDVALMGVTAAKKLHDSMLKQVPWAPQSFFDTTPAGRILNRFSGDVYTVDETLMPTLASLLLQVFSVVGTIAVIASATPLFLTLLLPLSLVYAYTQRYYVSTSRELQRLNSASRSPIFAQFSEALSGAVTIRAYADQPRFRRLSDALVDTNQSAYFAGVSANRWLAVRLELVGALITTGAALFAVLARDSVDPSVAGLSISYALSITQTLNWTVRMMSDAETQIVAVERIEEYAELETEPRDDGKDAESIRQRLEAESRLATWPSRGAVTLRDLRLSYRKGTPEVLHGVNLDVEGGHKVGIVGRTGAGKSSLVSALFRLADAQSGLVAIDGVDITSIPLRILRSRVAIIPQEAILLVGTIRSNLDPLGEHADSAVLASLEQVGVADQLRERAESPADAASAGSKDAPSLAGSARVPPGVVEGAASILDIKVSEGGENFSAGTRQLLCVARALLRRCKVVVMDEASSAMDAATDSSLQHTMRTEFGGVTVLTIAHRLHTIIDSDRVVVMDKGRVAEHGAPRALLDDAESSFSSLVRESMRAGEA
ncbi:hypothetical protein FNF28_05463 [Cafeteria roenbergensis]|uniref:Uncharacterized protein n=3 Tax=Cafeteria roenbergensis TaxID=33653 RepID=A0A5A8D6Z0_CAFRO|nr:hypothetical protein FNF28_05463 [Cafeteria roenbergensis]